MSQNRVSYVTRNNLGVTRLMHQVPSSTSTLRRRLIIISRWRGNGNQRYRSGRRVVASTSRTRTAAIKVSRSPVGTTPTVLRGGTSLCRTWAERSAGQLSPRRRASLMMPMVSGTTRQNRYLAPLTHLRVLYPDPCRCPLEWESDAAHQIP
ncbi:hypothetical protein KGM_210957 [Danaus plexippus plexippus]|uniref:Uncharacterized protein n=1 Tax=Danaus plexippus plexippus TaxID=278856 RepID=A0A212F8E1_DANPL|nr:hypothetical protein KGM_210957 [Danaus plexippus plexippus]